MLALAQRLKTFSPGSDTGLALGVAALIAVLVVPLPPFLRESEDDHGFNDQDLLDGFRLTGLFLLRHVLEPRGQGHSDAREGFINAVTRARARLAQV